MARRLDPERRRQLGAVLATIQGVLGLAFGSLLLVVLVIQRAALASLENADDLADGGLGAIEALHGVWLVHAPIVIALGGLSLAGGVGLFRRAPAGRTLVRLAATLAILWVVGYGVHVMVALPAFLGTLEAAGGGVASVAETLVLVTLAAVVLMVWIVEMILLGCARSAPGDGGAAAGGDPPARPAEQ